MSNEATKKITEANIAAWDEAAPIHSKLNQDDLKSAFSDPSYSCLDEIETQRLLELGVQGKDVAQICCNNGQELVSVKRMGAARCVGFDGASGFIDQAKDIATSAKLDVEFVCTDIYDLDARYRSSFDIVTITIGVLSWMPDLATFMNIVCSLLRPGAALFIYEQHPILDMIKPAEADEPIEWELSYFNSQPYVETHGLDYFSGETYEAKPVTSFTHKLSDIIMAGLREGLHVEHFEELPGHISNTWWNVEKQAIGLPMSFTLVMRKP